MNNRNSESVTAIPCTCGYLARGARDPRSPIVFNGTMNEYHFTWSMCGRDASMLIRHCPWCGGVASESLRDSLFHELKRESCDEIAERTELCQTLNDVLAVLGKPDEDEIASVKHYETHDMPPRLDKVRRITFHHLFEEMSVACEQQVGGTIAWLFIPKPLKPMNQ